MNFGYRNEKQTTNKQNFQIKLCANYVDACKKCLIFTNHLSQSDDNFLDKYDNLKLNSDLCNAITRVQQSTTKSNIQILSEENKTRVHPHTTIGAVFIYIYFVSFHW